MGNRVATLAIKCHSEWQAHIDTSSVHEVLCMKSNQTPPGREQFMTLAAGRIRCRRCQALSKRTKKQCKAPAVREKRRYKTHGAFSKGPITDHGKKRCAEARTIHGGETRAIRAARPALMAELKILEKIIKRW